MKESLISVTVYILLATATSEQFSNSGSGGTLAV